MWGKVNVLQLSAKHGQYMVLLLLLSRFSRVRLCDPIDGSPPGSALPGILQAATLEWVAISFSNAWKWKVKVKSLSCVQLLRPHGLQPSRLLCPWDFPHKNTGVGCHCLLLGIYYTVIFLCQMRGPRNNDSLVTTRTLRIKTLISRLPSWSSD